MAVQLGFVTGTLLISIQLVPIIQEIGGWGTAFAMLGFSPLLGIIAMSRLRQLPEAVKMANGNR